MALTLSIGVHGFAWADDMTRAEIEAKFQRAERLREEKQYQEAIPIFREVLGQDPLFVRARVGLALSLRSIDDVDGAVRELQKAAHDDPTSVSAHGNLGSILLGKGDVDGAIEEDMTALRLDPNSAALHYNLAGAFAQKEDFAAAIEHYRSAANLSPDLLDARYNLAQVLDRICETEAGIEELKTILKLAELHGLRGRAADEAERVLVQGNGERPIHLAAIRNQTTLVRRLLKEHADPNDTDKDGNTPLHFAACAPDARTTEALLSHGAKIDSRNSKGDTPLIAAAYCGSYANAASLLARGADVNARSTERIGRHLPPSDIAFIGQRRCEDSDRFPVTLLDIAIGSGNLPLATLALKHSADVNAQVSPYGLTPLHSAALDGNLEAAQLLLTHGADATARNTFGHTAYDLATVNQSADQRLRQLLQVETEEHFRRSLGWSAETYQEWDTWQGQWRHIDEKLAPVRFGISPVPGFSYETAITLGVVAGLAYSSEPVAKEVLKSVGFRVEDFINASTNGPLITALVAGNEDVLVVSFRGTASWADLSTDVQWLPTDQLTFATPPGARLHRGFYRAWASMRDHVTERIHALRGRRKVFLTGHSLGAAVATVALADLLYNTPEYVDGVYVFGSPRVGNGAFAAAIDDVYHGRFIDIRNNRDVITRVPPGWGFTHTGTPVLLDQGGFPWLWQPVRSFKDEFFGITSTPRNLTDHFINNYFQQLLRGPNTVENPWTFEAVKYGAGEEYVKWRAGCQKQVDALRAKIAERTYGDVSCTTPRCQREKAETVILNKQVALLEAEIRRAQEFR